MFVLVFGPFAFGSVHPQAYGLLEIGAFLLVLVWAAKLWGCGPDAPGVALPPRRLWMPIVGFLAVVMLQLVPLPPAALKVISPGTYELYAMALPGWPEKAPYEDVVRDLLARDDLGVQAVDLAQPIVLPSAEDVARFGDESIVPDAWGRLPGEPLLERNERQQLERWVERDHKGFFAAWRSVSLDPARTWAELLKIFAYLAIFSVVTLFPLERGSREDARFQRRLLRAVAFTAIAVAAVGLLQRFSWNGKILWFFVPWDWGEPRVSMPQTSGPFVSRNNFGGYLALTLPLVLVPLLARTRLDLRRPRVWTQALFGAGAAVVAVALFFSVSRGSWGAAAVSLVVLLWGLLRRLPAEQRVGFLRTKRAGLKVSAALATVMLLFILVPTGGFELGSDIDRRLEQTVSSSASWDARVESWRDTLPMIGDFPIFGVGLSAWGTIFPKYDESFFLGSQAHRAHNDYIQVLSETGLLGAVLLGMAIVLAGRRLLRALAEGSDRAYVVHLAIATGLLALLVHEFVDFDLQMPGIAATAAVLLGLGLRDSWTMEAGQRLPAAFTPAIASLGALLLCLVVTQATPRAQASAQSGLVAALRGVERRPTRSAAHMALGVGLADVGPEFARSSLDAAVALNPGSPGPRDARAVAVAQLGDDEQALRDIEESMFRAPSRAAHPLLSTAAASWLPPESREAAERGFKRAMDGAGYRAAVALAGLYSGVADRQAAAAAWEQAAELAPGSVYVAALLRRSGWELLQAEDLEGAESRLRRAIAAAPSEGGARGLLIASILGPRGDLEMAEVQAKEAVSAGADAYEMDLALAEAGRAAGQPEFEISVLKRGTGRRPADLRGHYRLGRAYFRLGDYARAASAFEAASRVSPEYAPAWYYLAVAAERGYRFELAGRAFERAVAEAPSNAKYREQQKRFTARLENG